MELTLDIGIEIAAVFFGLAYVVAIALERSIGWWLGILGSALSIWLFYRANLKAESILYAYYVIMGFYGWWNWRNSSTSDLELKKNETKITELKGKIHLLVILIGVVCSYGLGIIMTYFNSAMPYFDALSTVFSFIATWLTARKVLSNWIYWIIIDAFSIWLYVSRGLNIYALLMAFYTVMAVLGYFAWKRDAGKNKIENIDILDAE